MDTKTYKNAVAAFDSGLYCAESVLKVIAEEEGIDSSLFPGIATGFCSGMARTGNMCGAVTGAILALNLVHGRHEAGDSVEKNYKTVQALISAFESEFGTSNCRDLLGIDLASKEGQKLFSQKQMHLNCREYTGKAAELTRAIIDNGTKA